jgi:hypothetical protein
VTIQGFSIIHELLESTWYDLSQLGGRELFHLSATCRLFRVAALAEARRRLEVSKLLARSEAPFAPELLRELGRFHSGSSMRALAPVTPRRAVLMWLLLADRPSIELVRDWRTIAAFRRRLCPMPRRTCIWTRRACSLRCGNRQASARTTLSPSSS